MEVSPDNPAEAGRFAARPAETDAADAARLVGTYAPASTATETGLVQRSRRPRGAAA